MAAADTLTVIRARGRRLAKLIRGDGVVEAYDDAKHFDLFTVPVLDLDALHMLLQHLMLRPDCAIVRGVPIDPKRCTGIRRLAFPDKRTGQSPTLRAMPHRWAALDLDGVEKPASVLATDLAGCAFEAVQRLPGAFRGVRCIVQASASHGIKPGCRLRLWFWLDRITTDAEMKRWLRAAPTDLCMFRTVQLIYTAAPVFAAGARDHLPTRIVVMPGRPTVAVPSPEALAPAAPRPAAPMPKPTDAGSGAYAFAALTNAAVRVCQAGVGRRHDTILNEARGLARFIKAGLLTESSVRDTLCDAGTDAGKASNEIGSIIDWALEHPAGAALPSGVTP